MPRCVGRSFAVDVSRDLRRRGADRETDAGSLLSPRPPRHGAAHMPLCLQQDLEISGGMPMRQLYGSALPARLDIERQIASRPMRLPGFGLPSSKLGLEQISGQLGVMTPQASASQLLAQLRGSPRALASAGLHARFPR